MIFILSSMTGFLSLIIVLVLITLLVLFVGLGIWAYERKRRMISESISLPLTIDDMKVLGISYRPMTPTTPSLSPYYSSRDSNSISNHSIRKYWKQICDSSSVHNVCLIRTHIVFLFNALSFYLFIDQSLTPIDCHINIDFERVWQQKVVQWVSD